MEFLMGWFSTTSVKSKVVFPSREGSNNSNAKITERTASEIKTLLDQGMGQTEISKKLNVSYQIVDNIKRGLAWK